MIKIKNDLDTDVKVDIDNGDAIDDIKDEDDNVNNDDEAQSFINNEKMFLIKIFFTPLGMFYF